MAAKRKSPAKKPTRRKAVATHPPELTDRSAQRVRETTPAAPRPDPTVRYQLVATAAYFLAERRGFAPGHELEDWVAAEALVELRMAESKVA